MREQISKVNGVRKKQRRRGERKRREKEMEAGVRGRSKST